jgi:hypothetical protein
MMSIGAEGVGLESDTALCEYRPDTGAVLTDSSASCLEWVAKAELGGNEEML